MDENLNEMEILVDEYMTYYDVNLKLKNILQIHIGQTARLMRNGMRNISLVGRKYVFTLLEEYLTYTGLNSK